MAELAEFKFDLAEKFPQLSNAPIVEAVIHWQAIGERWFQQEELRVELAKRLLPQYPNLKESRAFLGQVPSEATIDHRAKPTTATHEGFWNGWQFSTSDNRKIAQFAKNGVIFSQLWRYSNWETFLGEGQKIWRVFSELVGPSQVDRLGVRFINVIPGSTPANLPNYLREPPTSPLSLPLSSFMYQSTFDVPGHDFRVNVVKSMQPSATVPGPALILDIHVFTYKRPFSCDQRDLDDKLGKLRWLKNKVFFEVLSKEAIEQFGRQEL